MGGVPVTGAPTWVSGEGEPSVILETDGSLLNAAPTNYHVICPPKTARRDTKKKANRFGSQFGMSNDTNTDVHSLR